MREGYCLVWCVYLPPQLLYRSHGFLLGFSWICIGGFSKISSVNGVKKSQLQMLTASRFRENIDGRSYIIYGKTQKLLEGQLVGRI